MSDPGLQNTGEYGVHNGQLHQQHHTDQLAFGGDP